VPCSWRERYSFTAQKYNSIDEGFEIYYSVDRNADITSWPNVLGLFLFPLSVWHDTVVDSLEKDILIAIDRSDY
jgi:hypothetical protein